METELIDICKKPSEFNDYEQAVINAMQSSVLSLLDEAMSTYGSVYSYDPDTDTHGSDVLFMAIQGNCNNAVRKALSYINENNRDLFEEEFILSGNEVKHFPDHFIGILKGKDGNYYGFSPANFLTEEVAEIMGTYNHLGHFIKSPDLKSLLAFIQETEEGFWTNETEIQNNPGIKINTESEIGNVPVFYFDRQESYDLSTT